MTPRRIPTEAIVSSLEAAKVYQEELTESTRDHIKSRVASTIQPTSIWENNLTRDEQPAVKQLIQDKDIVERKKDDINLQTVQWQLP